MNENIYNESGLWVKVKLECVILVRMS